MISSKGKKDINFLLFLLLFYNFSDRIEPGWKAKLQIPPKDNRIKTSVRIDLLNNAT